MSLAPLSNYTLSPPSCRGNGLEQIPQQTPLALSYFCVAARVNFEPFATSVATMPMTITPPPYEQIYSMERKLKKPLMEKKRRARINQCLMEMKSLLLQAAPHQRSKLEKADILEMTVNYLRSINLSKQQQAQPDPSSVRQSYMEGYTNCAGAVIHYLNSHPEHVNSQMRVGLFTHLNGYLSDRVKNVPLTVSIPPSQTQVATPPYRSESPFSSGCSTLSPSSQIDSPTETKKELWRPW